MPRLQLTPEGRPPEIPDWAPTTSPEATIDLLIREWSRIAFDGDQPAPIRMKAMESLSKHAGMFIERHEIRTIDESRNQALESMFDSMTKEEKVQWLNAQQPQFPTEIAVANLSPPTVELSSAAKQLSQSTATPQETKIDPYIKPLDLLPPKQKRVPKHEQFMSTLPEFLKR